MLSRNDNKDIDDKKIVDNYLPSSNVEERIIGGINYLAADAGLALLDISMKASLENKSANSIVTNNVTTENSTKDKAVNNMQFNETSILISGEYEKIGLFIDKLQKMALLNSINSLTIKKISGTVSDNTDKQVSDSKNLNAEIIVKFGYLKTVNSDNQIANVDPKLDKETVDALRFYVSAKDVSTSAISEPALKGKKNPFFLE